MATPKIVQLMSDLDHARNLQPTPEKAEMLVELLEQVDSLDQEAKWKLATVKILVAELGPCVRFLNQQQE